MYELLIVASSFIRLIDVICLADFYSLTSRDNKCTFTPEPAL